MEKGIIMIRPVDYSDMEFRPEEREIVININHEPWDDRDTRKLHYLIIHSVFIDNDGRFTATHIDGSLFKIVENSTGIRVSYIFDVKIRRCEGYDFIDAELVERGLETIQTSAE